MSDFSYDTFYLIDLDRTIFNTVKGAELITAVIAEYDSSIADIIRARIEEYAHFGVSFSIHDSILEFAGEAVTREIEQKFIDAAKNEDLLLPGAAELLKWVSAEGNRTGGILTFGSIAGQRLKIIAAELSLYPFLVTDQPHKGVLMASWWQGEEFVLPEEYGSVRAKRLVLIDDRMRSFEGLPAHSTGYWITSEQMNPFDEVPVPAMVTPIRTLTEVIERENEKVRA